MIRGLSHYPTAFTTLNDKVLKVFGAEYQNGGTGISPGGFLTDNKTYLKFAATDGFVSLTDVQWEGLNLPINLAFFVYNSQAKRIVALYPSPGGATEALPPPDAWEAVVEDNPSMRDLEPDVPWMPVLQGFEPEEYLRNAQLSIT